MGSRVRVRWDRVCVLLTAVVLLIVVVGHGMIRRPTAGEIAPPRAEPVAAPVPVAKPCPPPMDRVLHTAPHQDGKRTVALTFDDGPGPWTDEILAVLARKRVKATFFVVGREAAGASKQIRQMYTAGHAVENHSWSHPSAGRRQRWNPRMIGAEIRRTSATITKITGRPPCYFRPPHGVVPGAKRKTQAAGLSIALWSVDTRDWAARGPRAAASIRIRAQGGLDQPNPIILLHDGGGNRKATVAALPMIIDDYRRQGYAFVTLWDGHF